MFALHSFGQAVEQPSGSVMGIAVVVEQRITPIPVEYTSNSFGRPGLYVDEEAQLMGRAMGLDLSADLFRHRITLIYGTRFKYDVLSYTGPPNPGVGQATYYWSTDHLFSLGWRHLTRRGAAWCFYAGIGFMNEGSKYAYTVVDSLPGGQTIALTEFADFEYQANHINVTYVKGRFQGGLTMYYAKDEPVFHLRPSFLLPAFSVGYRFL